MGGWGYLTLYIFLDTAIVVCGESYPQFVVVWLHPRASLVGWPLVWFRIAFDLGGGRHMIKGSTLCERLALVPSSSFRLLCSHTTVLSCANPAFTNILYFFVWLFYPKVCPRSMSSHCLSMYSLVHFVHQSLFSSYLLLCGFSHDGQMIFILQGTNVPFRYGS